jgi:hypothetical protein
VTARASSSVASTGTRRTGSDRRAYRTGVT